MFAIHNTKLAVYVNVFLLLFLTQSVRNVSALDFKIKSEKELVGQSHNVDFSSALVAPNLIITEIKTKNNVLKALVDYQDKVVSIEWRSVKADKLAQWTERDLIQFHLLRLDLLNDTNIYNIRISKVFKALQSTLDLMNTIPPGNIVDIYTKDYFIDSLCSEIGHKVTGIYTIQEESITETKTVGPCGSDSCMGRCGPECNIPPTPSTQRFTMDCFNHDLCTRATGNILGPCQDEFNHADDDFFFGKDCEDISGTLTDNYGRLWELEYAKSSSFIIGKVLVTNCGTWDVYGAQKGFNVILQAINPSPTGDECCSQFRYIGTFYCNEASGTWSNACNLEGEWKMTRGEADASLSN